MKRGLSKSRGTHIPKDERIYLIALILSGCDATLTELQAYRLAEKIAQNTYEKSLKGLGRHLEKGLRPWSLLRFGLLRETDSSSGRGVSGEPKAKGKRTA